MKYLFSAVVIKINEHLCIILMKHGSISISSSTLITNVCLTCNASVAVKQEM
jgi:hypothetical protein